MGDPCAIMLPEGAAAGCPDKPDPFRIEFAKENFCNA